MTLPNFPFLFPFGPLLAALIVAGLTGGMRDLLSRCLRWRVGLQWYAAALLVGPAIGLAAVYLNVLLGAPAPTAALLGPWYGLFLLFPGAVLDAPVGEEPGWRGFGLPRFSANRLSVVDLIALDSSGAGSFEIDELDTDRLTVTLSGAGDIGIDSLRATDLESQANGAGNIRAAGAVETQEIDLSGFGNYNAPDLESRTASVRISGAGNAVVWVLDTLDVEISGAGNVEYFGSPEVTRDISGAGKVASQGDK